MGTTNGVELSRLAGIRYLGSAGYTQPCIEAVQMLLSAREPIQQAQLLTSETRHCFLIWHEEFRCTAIKSGFRSGYQGEGPRGLSYVLALLHLHKVELNHFSVEGSILDALDASALTIDQFNQLQEKRDFIGEPWADFVMPEEWNRYRSNSLWPSINKKPPWTLIEPRIMDLALAFETDADAALMKAYRRLESTVRKRTGLKGEGEKLFSAAFLQKNSPLYWPNLSPGACTGRGTLFTGVFKGLRNSRIHDDHEADKSRHLHEFMLVNELFWLEKEAVLKVEPTPGPI